MSTAHYTLSGREAGDIATHARYLLRRRVITPFQHALLDVMLWGARKPGSATLIAPLKALARMAGQGRSAVAEGIKRLEELGLLQRIRRRVRVTWIGGGQASRQVANLYRLIVPHTESMRRTAKEQPLIISILTAPTEAVKAAQEALERRRAAVAAMLGKGSGVL
jgi:DNA-binding Lrp family transcriptional regulator